MKKCNYCNSRKETEAQIFMLPFTEDSQWESDINFNLADFQRRYLYFYFWFVNVTVIHIKFLFDYYFQKNKGQNSDLLIVHNSHCI